MSKTRSTPSADAHMSRSHQRTLWAWIKNVGEVSNGAIIQSTLLGSLTLLSALSLMVVSAWLIVRASQTDQFLVLSVAATGVRALGIFRAVFRYVERLSSHDLGLGVAASVRTSVYTDLSHASTAYALQSSKGKLLDQLIADTQAIADLFIRALIPNLVAIVVSTLAVIGMCFLNLWAALGLAICFIISGVIAPVMIARATSDTQKSRVKYRQDFSGDVEGLMTNSAQWALAGKLDSELESAAHAADQEGHAIDSASSASAFGVSLLPFASGIAVLIALVMAGLSFDPSNTAMQMTAAMTVFLALSAFEAHTDLGHALIQCRVSMAATQRLYDLSEGARESADFSAQDAGELESTDDFTLAWEDLQWGWGEDAFLDTPNIPHSRRMSLGERLWIKAPSGTGKTTFLMTIAGLIPPEHGHVELGDSELSDYTREFVCKTITFHPEDEWIFATSVRENLHLAASHATDAELEALCVTVGLGSWLTQLKDDEGRRGLDAVLSEGGSALSAGQRRRLLLIRALISDAEILLLDEPLENMDAAATVSLTTMLNSEELPGTRAVRTIIAVTHTEV